MTDKLLVLWVATLGLTRVDFSGPGDFLLGPFLLLSPVVIGVGLMHVLARGGAFRLPPRVHEYVMLLSLLLSVVLISAFFGADMETAARRTLLLFAQVGSVLLAGVVLANRPRPRRILARGAMLGLALSIVFNVLQVTFWFAADWLPEAVGAVISIQPGNYQGLIPRLTGASHDPNHGGLLILAYMFLLFALAEPSRRRTVLLWAGGISLLLTLSRSVLLAGAVMGCVWWVRRSGRRVSPAVAMGSAFCVGMATAALLVFPAAMQMLETAWDVVGGRFTLGEGSSQQHSEVMWRGWEVATTDLKHLLLGVGYGNAYTTLQDIFPGNRYGNFHSLFVTLFAESGVLAVAFGVFLFLVPLARGGIYQPMIAGLLVFNLFQQSPTEPMTWLLLLLAWTGIGASAEWGSRAPEVGSPVDSDVRRNDDRVASGSGARLIPAADIPRWG